nr:phage tail length tape measure family protein [uncultured Celeribacter sp.]
MFKGLIGALRVDLGMNSAQFQKGSKEALSAAQRLQKGMRSIGGQIRTSGGMMTVAMTLPLVAFAKNAMHAAEVQQEAVASMEAGLASMGAAAGFTSEQLQTMASGLQNTSLYGDEEILSRVTANLLTFGNVSGEVFSRTQAMALDLSARLGTDLQSSTIMLGKALNDPAKGITALTRVGVSFTEQQKDQIKAMSQAGDVAGAQSLILDELSRQYAGQAQAMRDLPSGQIEAATMAIGDAMEKVGDVLLPVVAQAAGFVEELAIQFQTLDPELQKSMVTGAALAAALGPVTIGLGIAVAAVGALISPVGLVVAGFAALSAGVAYLAFHWDEMVARWTKVEGLFSGMNALVAAPIVLMVDLGRKAVSLVRTLGGFGETFLFVRDLTAEVIGRLGVLFEGFQGRFGAIVGDVKAVWANAMAYLAGKWSDFLTVVAPGFNALAEKAGSDLRLDSMSAASWASGLENSARNARTLAENARLAADALISVAKAPLTTMERLNDKVEDVAEQTEDSLSGSLNTVASSIDQIETELEDSGNSGGRAGDKIASGLGKAIPVAKELAQTLAEISTRTFDNLAEGLADSLSRGDLSGGIRGVVSDYMSGAQKSFAGILKDAFSGGGFASIGSSLSGAWSGITSSLAKVSLSSLGSTISGIAGAVSAALPIVGAVTAVVSLIKGFSSKKLIGAGLDFSFDGSAISGGTYETWKKKSFWGLKTSVKTKLKAFDSETEAALTEQVAAMQKAVAATYKAAGEAVEAGFIEGFAYDFGKIATKGLSEEEIAEKLGEAFSAYGDAMSEAIGGVGLELATTFAQVKSILEPSGQAFLGTFAEMAKAASSVADLVGGTEALASGVSSFVSTYFSEAERFRMVSDQVSGVFADLGLAVPDTLRGFRELILSQDLMTENGREAYAALLGVSDAFASLNAGLDQDFDATGGWYANEFDARLAQVASSRGYSVATERVESAGTTQYGRTSLGGEEGAAVQLLQTMVGVFKRWDEEGYPQQRAF